VELLACDHAAHVGGKRICPHLAGEHADELDKAGLMRGSAWSMTFALCSVPAI
jgi:hypothetical protein